VTQVSSIARRYAEAYFELAREAGDIPGWRAELVAVAEAFTRPEVATALSSPRLSMSERTRLGMELLDGVATPARNLARLLIEHRRTRIVDQVLAHYDRLADAASGIVRAEVTTAIQPDEQLETAIAHALTEKFGGSVQTTVVGDPSIIGGLVIRVGDRVIDDSLRTHLQQLQAALA
jgi:F-type H+-transporting ATPase subunit delta